MPDERERGPDRSRWTSFMADPRDEKPRILYEQGNPAHRLRVEHDQDTLLVHLSDEDGGGWTVLAVDRATRRCVVSQAPRQLDAAQGAYLELYGGSNSGYAARDDDERVHDSPS